MRSQARLLLVLSLVATALVPAAGTALAGNHHSPPPGSGPDAVLQWNQTATSTAIACGLSNMPPVESRLYAVMHIAIHDALNAIKLESRPYAYAPSTLTPGASPNAAVAAAGTAVLTNGLLGCAHLDKVDSAYSEMLASIPDGNAKATGVALGVASAAAILAERSSDQSANQLANPADPNFPQGTAPGEWKFTPGDDGVTINGFAFLPEWGTVDTFVLQNSGQFSPSGPYPLSSREYARDFNEVKSLGGNDPATTKRTDEQTKIALFWVGSAPYQWNDIARTVAVQSRKMDLWANARLFGLLNMAMADGYIASFATKYDELFWRPVTAIREADTDGNARTVADPTWAPLVTTPPIPDYESAHAVEGGAAAAVLGRFFPNRTSFSNCSPWSPADNSCAGGTGPGDVRNFSSFSQAATENANSRIYVGFHFRKATEDGNRRGHQIGSWAVSTAMRPCIR